MHCLAKLGQFLTGKVPYYLPGSSNHAGIHSQGDHMDMTLASLHHFPSEISSAAAPTQTMWIIRSKSQENLLWLHLILLSTMRDFLITFCFYNLEPETLSEIFKPTRHFMRNVHNSQTQSKNQKALILQLQNGTKTL